MSLCALGLLASGCLPGDDRPLPGSVLVTVGQNDATKDGFVTDDGWSVRYRRFVTALGDIRLDNANDGDGGPDVETCNDYAETRYDRLFDFTVATPEKIGLVYGLGQCRVGFRLQSPDSDAILGGGVNAGDRERMRIEFSDAYTTDERVALLVEGDAVRGGVHKSFSWSFRQSYNVRSCPREEGSGIANLLDIQGGAALGLTIEVRGDELFRSSPSDDAPLAFEAIAAADADADGVVTLEELALVEIPFDAILADFRDQLPADAVDQVVTQLALEPNLATLLYRMLVPRVARYVGSTECVIGARGGGF